MKINNLIQQKLINAINKITVERNWLINKIEFLEHQIDQKYDVNKPTLKFEKTLLNHIEISTLLYITTKFIYFEEIFSKEEYIQEFIDLFDILEECKKDIEKLFNLSIYFNLKNNNEEIILQRYVMNLTDVFDIIDKNLENKNLEDIVAEYIHNTTELDLDYCKYIAPDIIDKF